LDFKIGDAVKLKEGSSPVMIVSSVDVPNSPDHVECKWYSDPEKVFKTDVFHKDMLRPYERQKGKVY